LQLQEKPENNEEGSKVKQLIDYEASSRIHCVHSKLTMHQHTVCGMLLSGVRWVLFDPNA